MTGFKDWASGQNPSAAEFDTLLQAQVVGIYDNATDRDTQITILTLGMRAVTMDDGVEWIYADDGIGGGEWQEYGRWLSWGTYTPALTVGTGTDPTLGTGPTQIGRYHREGSLATVAIYLAFGTSMAAGSGTYEISLPAACPVHPEWYGAEELIAGNGIAIDSSTGTRKQVAIKTISSGKVRLEADGLTSAVTDANLIAWGDSDLVLSGVITYEVEPLT